MNASKEKTIGALEIIGQLLEKRSTPVSSNRYSSLTGRHQKLYRLRNMRLLHRLVRDKYPQLLATEIVEVQPITDLNLFYPHTITNL